MYNIKKKANDSILRKFSDWRKDGRTDGQTDESGFMGRFPTDVERPIIEKKNLTELDGHVG